MCLFDERTASFATLQSRSVTTATGSGAVGDVSKLLLLWATDGDNVPVPLGLRLPTGAIIPVPADARYSTVDVGTPAGALPYVYSRQSLGPLVRADLRVLDINGAGSCNVYWFELDSQTFGQVVTPPG